MRNLTLPPLSGMSPDVQAAFRAVATWAREGAVSDSATVIVRQSPSPVSQPSGGPMVSAPRSVESSAFVVASVLQNSGNLPPIEMNAPVLFRAGNSSTNVYVGAGGIGGMKDGIPTWGVASADGSFFFGKADAANPSDPAHKQIIFNATNGVFQFGKDIVVQTSAGAKTLDAIATSPGYTKTNLQNDLNAGVASLVAGIGADFRLEADTTRGLVWIHHKDASYSTPTGPYSGNFRTGLGITANGIAAGYNDKTTGAWVNSFSIDAVTGTASFSGNINATSGNFTGTVTAGAFISGAATITGTGTTIGSLEGSVADSVNKANNALNGLNDILSDNKITPLEKQSIRAEWDVIQSERFSLVTQATNLSVSISTVDYVNKFIALGTFLNGSAYTSGVPYHINNTNLTSTVDLGPGSGDTFRTRAKEYYDARTALIGAMTSYVKDQSIVGLTTKLNKSAPDTLSAVLSVDTTLVSGLRVSASSGNPITWNAAGTPSGGAGVAITPNGIVGWNGSSTTFTIDKSGNATFAGALSAASGSFSTVQLGSGIPTSIHAGMAAGTNGEPTGDPSVTTYNGFYLGNYKASGFYTKWKFYIGDGTTNHIYYRENTLDVRANIYATRLESSGLAKFNGAVGSGSIVSGVTTDATAYASALYDGTNGGKARVGFLGDISIATGATYGVGVAGVVTGSHTYNLGGYFKASGGTTNYALFCDGDFNIQQSSPGSAGVALTTINTPSGVAAAQTGWLKIFINGSAKYIPYWG